MHIKGKNNVWADLLGRWSASGTVRRLVGIPDLLSSPAKSSTDRHVARWHPCDKSTSPNERLDWSKMKDVCCTATLPFGYRTTLVTCSCGSVSSHARVWVAIVDACPPRWNSQNHSNGTLCSRTSVPSSMCALTVCLQWGERRFHIHSVRLSTVQSRTTSYR